MSPTKKTHNIKDIMLAICCTVVLIIVVGILFDYYYEFNDDVLMKNMLSGAYSGKPSSYNIQMLWPISALISLIYHIFPSAPVYGIFLCACHYICICIMILRASKLSPNRRAKLMISLVGILFFASVALPHLVLAQYTITVAIISATAAFYFYTIPEGLSDREFIKEAIPAILLVYLAFLIRSEMLLLMLPFIAITGLIRWDREKNSYRKNILLRYALVVAVMFVGMGVFFGIDKLAYSGDGWQKFLAEFDARTKLYDYQYVPEYAENEEFYRSIGLSEADVALLKNYDYAIDSKINGQIIQAVADKAEELRADEFAPRLINTLREYKYRVLHFVDAEYAVLTLFLYVMFIWALLARKESTLTHKIRILVLRIGGLLFMRSVPWIYIIWGRREPDRIVHSLYIIEIVILMAMIMTELNSKIREKGYIQMIIAVVLIGGEILLLPMTISRLNEHIENQERINRLSYAIDDYCKAHPDAFFFEDVYSTIRDGETFNEKMFVGVDNSIQNYDLIGGWSSNSPLYREKLANYGIDKVADAVLDMDNVYIICDEEYSMDWVINYYASQKIDVNINQVDTIAQTFGVYAVSER